MGVSRGATARKRQRQQMAEEKPYEIVINEKTGELYLRQERNPFWGELPYVLVLVGTICFALTSYCQYIQLRTSVECHVRTVAGLQSRYYQLKNENVLSEKETAAITDLDRIYRIATEELGMVQANADNVVLYDRTNSEYVYQTDNIPLIEFR